MPTPISGMSLVAGTGADTTALAEPTLRVRAEGAYDFACDERDCSTSTRAGARPRRPELSGAAAEAVRPAAPPRCGDHLASGPRPGRVRLQPVDRADPDRDRDVRRAR